VDPGEPVGYLVNDLLFTQLDHLARSSPCFVDGLGR
jgi:hypothetical protein